MKKLKLFSFFTSFKRRVSLFLCLFIGIGQLWADATFISSNEAASSAKNGISLSVTSGSLANGDYYRIDKGATLTISSTAGNIESIVFTCTTASYAKLASHSPEGTYSEDGTTVSWEGSANSVTFTAKTGKSNNNFRFSQVVITTASSSSSEPSISVQPVGATYAKDATPTALSVTAAAGKGGALSYQWYSNTTSSTTGASSISGATSASYTPSTAALGTKYYYCVVSEAGVATTVTSSIVAVVVKEPTGTFNKFTGTTLTEGDYVITYNTYTLKNSVNSNRWENGTAITSGVSSLINPDESIIWHISASGNYWLLYNAAVEKYAAGTNSKNQGSMVDMPQGGASDMMKWTPTVSNSTWQFENYGRSQAASDSGNKWLRNNGNSGWATYASSTGGALTLYKKALPTHAVTFTAAPAGGTVAVSAGSAINSGAQVEEGATVTITPTPSACYRIASVTKGGQAVTPVQGVYSFTMPASDVAIVVTFELIPVTSVTLNKSALELVEGATETLSVTSVLPNTAQNTVTWSSTNTNVATVTNAGIVTAVAAGNATIKATSTVSTSVFGSCAITVTTPSGNPITLLQNEGGTVTASVDVSDVIKETPVTLTATPEEGYSVSGWTVLDGNAVEITPTAQTANTFTFSMPDGEVTAEASFTHEEAVLKLHDAAGVTTYDEGNDHFWKESVTLPSTAATCSKTFVGWSADENRSTAPEIEKGASYTIPNKGENHLYAVYATQGEGITTWAEASLGALTASDIFVIVGNNGSNYAMTNDNGTSNPPAATSVTIADSKITSNVADNMKWNISGDAEDGYSFYPNGSTTTWLYCTNTNNGVRVGTNENKLFVIDDGYLKNSGTSRYVGVYNSSDWRCYTSINDNIKGQTFKFYKRTVEGGSYSGYTTSCQPVLDAPTFSVGAGTYYESKSITLSATNEADIYYTLDGSEPTTSSTKFSSAISLSERGTTTIKAIAVKDGFEDSEIATATYTINLPFATVGDLFSYLEENSLTSLNDAIVTGVISGVTEVSTSYGNATYFISNDGTTTDQLQVFRGKYVGNVAVSDENKDKFVAGNKVTVRGNIETSSNTLRFAQNNYMTELTEKVLSSVTVGGTASKTAYSEEDNQFSFAGLTATANYSNTGYSKDVTNEVTWKAVGEEAYEVTAAGNINVTATLGNATSEPKVVAVTFTTKTVKSIRLEYTSTYTFVGFDLPKPKVYASYVEDIPEEEVTELLTDDNYDTEDAYNKNVAGNYTIMVGYKSKEATYTVTVKAIYNTQETAHSVADAIEIIKKSTYTSTNADPTAMYVHGVVSEVGSISSGKLGYYINDTESTDGQLQVYQGLYFGSESFTNDNILAVGDEVIIEGHMLYYNSATPELKQSPLVYLLKKALPTISVEDVDELEVGQADLDITELITKQGNGVVSLESGDLEKLTVDGLTLHAVGAGDVTVTANLAATANTGSINYKANSTTFTVHVIAARTRYTITFDADGGTGTDPVIANQLPDATVELPDANPYSKENNKFMGWQVSYNETVLEKALGESFTMPAANVTIKPKWEEVATCAISFMVNDAEVFSANAPQEDIYNISQVGSVVPGFTFIGWSETAQAEEASICPDIITSYTPEAGEESKVLYGIYSRVEEDANYGKYEKATAVAEGDYLIVCEDENVVFDGSLATLDATSNTQAATISDGVLTLANADNYVFTIAAMTGGYSIKSASNKYIGNTGTKNGLSATADEILNQVSISNGNAVITSGSTNYLKYNKTSGQERFRYFSSNSQESIQLYKKNLGTTYYTSSPVEKVTITFNANGGEGGCEKAIINKGSQLTICAEAPTKLHSDFAGWKNSENVYVAGQTYTFNESLTLTAQWDAAATYAVTYSANGASGAVPTIDAQYAGDAFDVAAKGTLAKSGYDFQGWKYYGKLYAAGASFTMPASAVEFVAQWKKQNISTETMTLVTSESQLADGSKVVIANNKGTQQYLAGQLSSKYLIAENTNVTFNGNEVTYSNANVTEWTLVKAENGWQLKNGTNYLGESGDNLTIGTTNATVWTITISNGDVAITSGNYTIRYNYNNGSIPRFKTYGSTSTMALPQLYASVTAITDTENPVAISDLGYVEGDVIVVNSGVELTMDEPSSPASITVKEGATVDVSAITTADNLTVERGGKVTGTSDLTVVNDLLIKTSLGNIAGDDSNISGVSGEIANSNISATGDVFIEIELTQEAEASEGWYAFSVPFPVDAMNGVYYGDTKLTNEVGYAIMSYHGDVRAQGLYGWKKYRGIMQPGVLYIITVGDTDYKTLRFKKVAGENIVASNVVSVNKYASETGNDQDGGWNGIGNPNLQVSNYSATTVMQFLDHSNNCFRPRISSQINLLVGSAFMMQIQTTTTITISVGSSGSIALAPARERSVEENTLYELKLRNTETNAVEDNLFFSASEDATNTYEIGRDVAKFSMGTAKCAQMYVPAYGTQLCAADFPLVNGQAEYPLAITAPAAGSYRIETPTVYEDATLYLTYEGNIIWDLTVSPYEAEFDKGQNNDYGLMLVRKAPQVTTGVETIDNSQSTICNCQKVILNDHVYILRDAQLYDVTGKAVK